MPTTNGLYQYKGTGAGTSTTPYAYPTTVGSAGKIHISDGTSIVSSTPTYPNSATGTGKLLQADGTNWVASTPTFPTTAGTSGKILISDGTNIVSSTPTFPTTAGSAGKILISDGTNIVSSTPTYPNVATGTGKILQADGTNWTASTPTYPTTAGSAGKIHISDGTNIVSSTPTYPNSATGTGTILRADGTNWAATTATYPTTTTVNRILYSSAANTISEITTANNSVVLTDASGVPSLATSLLNDFTFTSATASATRTLTVSNSDNTSGTSHSLIKALTGGASSGDPIHQASTTTTVWSWGIDNSATSPTADPFVISQGTALGTNNVMVVATSGEINFPLQSSFSAYLPSDDNNQTGDNTTYTIGAVTALTKIYDQNSDLNTNGTYTAPITGVVAFSYNCTVSGTTVGMTTALSNCTTSNRTYAFGKLNPGAVQTATNTVSYTGSFNADMDAADTATFSVRLTNGTKVADIIGGSSPIQTWITGQIIA